jgi:hypothetical protein
MKIPPYPIHRFAKPGAVYYLPDHHCLIAGSEVAIVRLPVDDEDEPDKNRKAGTVPTDILAAACQSAAGSTCELRLTGRVARLDVTDKNDDNVMTLEVPTERKLFDDSAAKQLHEVIAKTHKGKAIALSLNPKVLAAMAAAMGSPEQVDLRIMVDEDGHVRLPIQVASQACGEGVLAPISCLDENDVQTASLFPRDFAQEMADAMTDKMPDGVDSVTVNGRRGRKKAEAKS